MKFVSMWLPPAPPTAILSTIAFIISPLFLGIKIEPHLDRNSIWRQGCLHSLPPQTVAKTPNPPLSRVGQRQPTPEHSASPTPKSSNQSPPSILRKFDLNPSPPISLHGLSG